MHEIDLEECEREPIHTPGAVQSHAAIIAVNPESLKVTHVSENIQAFTRLNAKEILSADWQNLAEKLAIELHLNDVPLGPESIEKSTSLHGQRIQLRAHKYNERIIIEFQKDDLVERREPVQESLPDLSQKNAFLSAHIMAQEFSKATGYDRTMIYRFHEDWSGEVIAEVCKKDAIPYIGLRYPASDIPKQARDLFLINRTRVIADTHSLDAAILSLPDESSLDCSCAFVRSVSPYHIEYLRNMNVYASLVCAIHVNETLWGLLVGHHDSPRLCHSTERHQADALANLLSERITEIENEKNLNAQKRSMKEFEELNKIYSENAGFDCIRHLISGNSSLQNLFDSNSAAIITDTSMIATGHCPEESLLRELIGIANQKGDQIVSYQELPDELKKETDSQNETAGALLGKLNDGDVWIFCGRPEQAHNVLWGGDPSKPVYRDEKMRLHPRKSFAIWKTLVKDTCQPWSSVEIVRMQQLLSILSMRDDFDKNSINRLIFEFKNRYDDNPGYDYIDLFAANEGIVLTVEENHSGDLIWRAANRDAYHLLGIDPLIHESIKLDEYVSAAGLTVDDLSFTKNRIQCWHANHGLRIMQTERQKILTVSGPETNSVYYSVSFFDVTLEERLLQAMKASRDRTESLTHTQDTFLSNLSHEMRNPLNAVIGLAEILDNSPEINDHDRHHYTGLIRSAGLHMLQMVNSLLDLSKDREGRLKLEKEDVFDLSIIAEESIQWVAPVAAKNSVMVHSLELIGVERSLPVLCDRTKISQVFVNLLANAVKFTHGSGNVYVRAGLDQNGSPFFEVEDTGIGIEPADLPHIFDRFYRAENRDVAGMEGSGLGLSLSKAFIELHSGVIQIASQPGHGTRIRCTLPVWRYKLDSVRE